ncbi:LacI family DNA-binding transcriptional regulator [Massilia sp. PAMC28688]|uniref:LacI family DNA-binding transcriptional regulator n=1 Tax=Massilia sp. PAMC28688 TaxID=2861283 RepID=UPI001C62E152|nr:LacI family DNA-binding transcriptional regulator [Massilia sp. PAMC28688]QYF92774.1 LacI family DNA-binding transcriptional regulator [Massilia sp. PAMC28688]
MATLKDVAQLAGVGLGTASRVVSGKGAVSPKTLERVRKAIAELDFQPSHAARSLMSGNSQMVGVYIPFLSGTFYTPILQLIYAELRAAGLNMVVGFGTGGLDQRKQAVEGIEFLHQRGCDGVLVMSTALLQEDIAALGPRAARMVLLNHRLDGMAERCFTIDHTLGGRMAARTLIDNKHRKIAVIAGPDEAADNLERVQGFMDELASAGIDPAKVWCVKSDFSPDGGWQSAAQLLASGHDFTAVFCANDEMAVGALSYFQQAGINVPGDVSVLGYDDTHTAEFTAPRLSSVRMPWTEMTLNGLNCLLNSCYGMDRPCNHDTVVSVTQRASVAKAKARSARAR